MPRRRGKRSTQEEVNDTDPKPQPGGLGVMSDPRIGDDVSMGVVNMDRSFDGSYGMESPSFLLRQWHGLGQWGNDWFHNGDVQGTPNTPHQTLSLIHI